FLVPYCLVLGGRLTRTKWQDHGMQNQPPQGSRDLDNTRIRQKLLQITAYRRTRRGIRRAEIDQYDSNTCQLARSMWRFRKKAHDNTQGSSGRKDECENGDLRRYLVQPASNSRACVRVVAVISSPPSMRAISSTRASASSAVMEETVLPLLLRLLTSKCWFA